jgi:hypothetical protein
MEESSVGKHEYGAKKDESSTRRIWAAGFYYVTARACLVGVLKLFISLVFQFFSGRSELWTTETADTKSADTGHTCISISIV